MTTRVGAFDLDHSSPLARKSLIILHARRDHVRVCGTCVRFCACICMLHGACGYIPRTWWRTTTDILMCVLHLRKTFYLPSVKAFAILPKVTSGIPNCRVRFACVIYYHWIYNISKPRLISRNVAVEYLIKSRIIHNDV